MKESALYIRVVPTWKRLYESNGLCYPWGMQGIRIPRDSSTIGRERKDAWSAAERNRALRRSYGST